MAKILIAEDEYDHAEVYARWLEDLGVSPGDMCIAEDVRTAMKLLGRDKYILMLLDIRLPKEDDGLDLLEWVRNRCPMNGDISVVVVSVRYDVDAQKRTKKLGVLDYMAKPVSPDEYQKRIGPLVEKLYRHRGGKE